ncbi:ABC transporter substrate-binding protein [Marinobacter sp. LQ44]|uniref:ABC transporter substrate-binding protein n=1 Tax=unclassified Marinobacter TaxID=83889 RepID=UPI000718DFF6|nr:ABC transporter substrate-binding protein [Marinobacter sp. LQ44]AMQ90994.1 hypothetical protein ASQ50_13005 [Marinobacter sp. LQ44]
MTDRYQKLSLAGLLAAMLLTATGVHAQPLVFRDVVGNEVTLNAQPQRIVTLPNPAAATLIALDGSAQRIVGMNQISRRAFEGGMMGVMFPEAATITSDILAESGGWLPNVEAIAALKPDLVIQWGRRGDDIVAPLRNAGLPVALMVGGGSGGTEALARENMRMVAEITGQVPKLAQLLDWRDRVMAEIGETLAKAGRVQKPRILHLRAASARLTATGRKSYQHTFIELVGAENVAAELGVESSVTSEQILAWKPDIILLSSADPEALPQRVYDDPLLSRLPAAQQQRIYKTPQGGYIWDSASPENPFTWMWLANLAHPELFAFDLRQELRQGFRLLYDFELSDADIDRILRLDVNAGARGYQVFSSP